MILARGLHLGPLPLDDAKERRVQGIGVVHVVTLRNGKVVSWRGHNDTAMLAEAYRGARA